MRYTVVWESDAEADLTRTWIAAAPDLRQALTLATAYFDHALAENAHMKGTWIKGRFNDRLFVAPPISDQPIIAVACEIIPDDRLVRVVQFLLVE